MTKDEALKMALEALESASNNEGNFHDYKYAAEALRQALEQAQQEPFGYFRYDLHLDAWVENREGQQGTPLYTAPPKQPWVGLTDDVIWSRWEDQSKPERSTRDFVLGFARVIENELKEKNGFQ
jgi:hypothetical protein